jgi:ABC-type branched-subunit amino acid transport system permease subunit
LACFFTGISGSFYASYFGILHPDLFTVWESILIQIQATLGGLSFAIAGPVVGAVVLNILSELLRATKHVEPVIYGGALIVILFTLPKGLMDLGPRVFQLIEKRTKLSSSPKAS